MHERFNRKVLANKNEFTGALAKWLVMLSPYTVPDNLETCITKFSKAISVKYDFEAAGCLGFVTVDLSNLTSEIAPLLWAIPEIAALNERKNGNQAPVCFTSRFSEEEDPDNDFIDITALAQNITCEFADEADLVDLERKLK